MIVDSAKEHNIISTCYYFNLILKEVTELDKTSFLGNVCGVFSEMSTSFLEINAARVRNCLFVKDVSPILELMYPTTLELLLNQVPGICYLRILLVVCHRGGHMLLNCFLQFSLQSNCCKTSANLFMRYNVSKL